MSVHTRHARGWVTHMHTHTPRRARALLLRHRRPAIHLFGAGSNIVGCPLLCPTAALLLHSGTTATQPNGWCLTRLPSNGTRQRRTCLTHTLIRTMATLANDRVHCSCRLLWPSFATCPRHSRPGEWHHTRTITRSVQASRGRAIPTCLSPGPPCRGSRWPGLLDRPPSQVPKVGLGAGSLGSSYSHGSARGWHHCDHSTIWFCTIPVIDAVTIAS